VLTDSGLGGLSICATIERTLREERRGGRLTFVNAWPEEGRGYNELPDMAARAMEFDRALHAMATLGPSRILIACNTLSIVYEHTGFRTHPPVAVQGIVDKGVEVFAAALAADRAAAIVLLGTRTTIESGAHRARLFEAGVADGRVGAASCHGLAAAIERGPASAETARLVRDCAGAAAEAAPAGEPLYLGLCCTHYGLIADRLAAAVRERVDRATIALDPNAAIARDVVAKLDGAADGSTVEVEVLSRVPLSEGQREGVADLLEPVSPATADALRRYRMWGQASPP
jgi:glutamate racemase